MRILIEYNGQLRKILDRSAEELELEPGSSVKQAIDRVAADGGEAAARLLYADSGEPTGVLCFVDGEQVDWKAPPALKDGDRLVLMSPVAGG